MVARALQLSANTPAEVTSARHAVQVQVLEWGCDHLEDLLLVFSELVTNAVTHAGGADRVVIQLDEAAVVMTVVDASASSPLMKPSGDASGGFGLRIVDQVAIAWGWERVDAGKEVWAKVRCSD
jgi:two-component sensor histidine kinase